MELVGDKHYECPYCGYNTVSPDLFMAHDCPVAGEINLRGISKRKIYPGGFFEIEESKPASTDTDKLLQSIDKKLTEILDQQRWLERVILERLG